MERKKKKKQCSLQRIRKNSILTLLSQVLALQSKSLGENDLDNQPNVVLILDNEEQKRLLKAGISWTFHTRSKIESRKLNYRNVYVCLCFCLCLPTIFNSRIIVSKTNTMIEKEWKEKKVVKIKGPFPNLMQRGRLFLLWTTAFG